MNVYGFARLFWRPMALIIPLGALVLFAQQALLDAMMRKLSTSFVVFGLAPETTAMLLILLLPGLTGFWVANAIEEIRNKRFAWTLPGRDRSLLAGVVCVGVLCSTLTAALHLHFWGYMHVPLWALALAWYSLAVSKAPRTLAARGQWRLRNPIALLAALGWVVSGRDVVALANSAPALLSIVALTVATFLLLAGFSQNAARVRAGQMILLWVDGYDSAKRKSFASLKATARDWNRLYWGDRLWGWVQARMYERRRDRTRYPVFIGCVLLFCLLPSSAGVGWSAAWQQPQSWAAGVWALIMNASMETEAGAIVGKSSFLLPWFLFSLSCLYIWSKEDHAENLTRVHPVSRRRRAQAAYVFYLTQSCNWCVASLAVIVAVGVAAGLVAGVRPLLHGVPLHLLAVAGAVLALAPLAQAVPICVPGRMRTVLVGLSAVAAVLAILLPSVLMYDKIGAFRESRDPLFDVATLPWLLPMLAVVTQGLFYRWLQWHDSRADLA